MKSQTIAQGAEAIISLDNNQIIKNRIKKSYRISVLDEKLRKSRTKSEAKIMEKLHNIIPVPKILRVIHPAQIFMEYIQGKKLSENLESLNYREICKNIAENISKIHNQNIIHGDLTTSNMIYVENNDNPPITLIQEATTNKDLNINNKNKISMEKASKRSLRSSEIESSTSEASAEENNKNSKIYFIDFGLAFHSMKIEDKAVDLHLLQQALEAKHFTIWKECWKIILDNYKADKHKEILQRIKTIESRGRYKDKY